MDDEQLRKRMRERLKALGRGAIEAAEKGASTVKTGKIGRDYIRDFVDDPPRKNSIKRSSLAQVAHGLDWTVEELLGVQRRDRGNVWPNVYVPHLSVVPPGHEFPPDPDGRIEKSALAGLEGSVTVSELDIRAGMGGGGAPSEEVRRDGQNGDALKPELWAFPRSFMREEVRAPADRIIIIETQGDSMSPTIAPGERVVVDTSHRLPSPDGIYALRDGFGLIVVKRLQIMRRGDPPRIRIISDNTSHISEEVGVDEIEIVGRVVCGLKRY